MRQDNAEFRKYATKLSWYGDGTDQGNIKLSGDGAELRQKAVKLNQDTAERSQDGNKLSRNGSKRNQNGARGAQDKTLMHKPRRTRAQEGPKGREK